MTELLEVPVVVQRRDPTHGRLRFGSVGPFYAASVLRRVFSLLELRPLEDCSPDQWHI